MKHGAFVETMTVDYIAPVTLQRKVLEYQRSHPMPADVWESERVETRLLFTNRRWGKVVPLSTAMDIVERLPVGARLIQVLEQDHYINIE
jgi:hypothetical protein